MQSFLKYYIYSIFLFCPVFAQSENTLYTLGVNNNIIIDNSDFKSGYTGPGLFFQIRLNRHFSAVMAFNTFKLNSSRSGLIKTAKIKITTIEPYIQIRYHPETKFLNIYPQLSFGGWLQTALYLSYGLGVSIPVHKNISLSPGLDYLIAFEHLKFSNSESWTSSMIKVNLAFSCGL